MRSDFCQVLRLGRPELLQRLTEILEIRLVVLLAPSGYGKTTLLAQLARNVRSPVTWLTLSEGCAEPETLTEAIGVSVSHLLPRYVAEVASTFRERLRSLGEALSQIPDAVTLIFDGIENLSAESGAALMRFCEFLGDQHRTVLSGFSAQHLWLYRHLSQGTATIIGPELLSFRTEETEALLRLRGFPANPDDVQRSVAGWPVAVGLLATGTEHGFTPERLIESALDQLSIELQLKLPQAALITVWNEYELRDLGSTLPNGWIDQVRLAGLPITPLGTDRYRPHDLLRQALLRRIQGEQPEITAMRRKVATRAVERGDFVESARLELELGDAKAALQSVSAVVQRSWVQAEFQTLRRVLEPFELSALDERHRALRGVALLETGFAEQGELLLNTIALTEETAPVLIYGQVRIRMRRGDTTAQYALCEQALGLPLSEVERARFERMRANALHNLDDFQAAIILCERLALEAERAGRWADLGNTLFVVQSSFQALRRWEECELALLRGISVFERLDLPARLIPLRVDLAELYRLTGRNSQAQIELDQLEPVAEREESEMLPVILESHGDLAFLHQDFQTAVKRYRSALKSCQRFGYNRIEARVGLKLSEVLSRLGQRAASLIALETASKMMPKGLPWLETAARYHQGVIAVLNGRIDVAKALFETVDGTSSDLFHSARATAWQCLLAHREGRLTSSLIQVLQNRLLGLQWEHVSAPDESRFEFFVHEAERQGWWTDDTAIARPNSATWVLEVTTLGAVKATINQQRVHLPLTRCGEILAFLVIQGPSRREEIVDALWNGSNERRHLEYFKVALRRLRVALTKAAPDLANPVSMEDGRYQLNPLFTTRLDVTELRQAIQAPDHQRCQRALSGYQGDFLPTSDNEWVDLQRQRFRRDAVTLALQIGDALLDQDSTDCLKAYQRAVTLDPFFEVAQQRLIKALLQLNLVPAAAQAFQDYERICQQELGRSPSKDLERSVWERLSP